MPPRKAAGLGARWAQCVALLCLLMACASASAATRIGVLTMLPGEVFFERFGHNALVVDTGDGREPTSYNFGYFDPEEPDFLARFVRGEMRYRLVALPLSLDLEGYRQSGRGVSMQWLDLDATETAALAAMLAVNARPENAVYDYRYFTDNCSTRVRDALDAATASLLKRPLTASSQGNTYRTEAVRLALPDRWMGVGFHLGLSAAADRPLSRWDESFIPMRLAEALRTVKRADGSPLVSSEEVLLPHNVSLPPVEFPQWRMEAMFAGLGLAFGVLWLGRRAPRAVAVMGAGFWAFAGVAGSVLAFLWLGSEHTFAHGNENLFLLSPLALLLVPGALRASLGRDAGRFFAIALLVVLVVAGIGAFLKLMPFMKQQNVEWVFLLLPLHWSLSKHFRRLAAEPRRAG